MSVAFLKKLAAPYIWRRIYYERLTEPLHLNVIALGVALFGTFRARVAHDLVLRQQHAFSILKCADLASSLGIREVTLIEFGVAAGAGLMNMCAIARRVTKETGVQFRVVGFDTGRGMPPPQSYRDHPELYQEADFPMDRARLESALPAFARLIVGDVATTVPAFLEEMSASSPVGFVSFDLDYYTSTRDAMRVLAGPAGCYLPRLLIYLDDLEDDFHNGRCGELLAVNEFNESHDLRTIERPRFLRSYRIFRNARWIDHMFACHVLDHPVRQPGASSRARVVLSNPYL